MKTTSVGAFALVFSLVALAACKKPEGDRVSGASIPSARATVTASATAMRSPAAEADDIYRARCATCHGDDGHGDGPSARVLQPKPRDFADRTFQAGTSDDALAKVIVQGGAAVGKSALMPKSPDLENEPEVVRELVQRVRKFAK